MIEYNKSKEKQPFFDMNFKLVWRNYKFEVVEDDKKYEENRSVKYGNLDDFTYIG